MAGNARSRGAGYFGVRVGEAVGRHQRRHVGGAACARRAATAAGPTPPAPACGGVGGRDGNAAELN